MDVSVRKILGALVLDVINFYWGSKIGELDGNPLVESRGKPR